MPKVLVLFHSRTGKTAAIAEAIARGAESVRFTEVELRRVDDLARRQSIGTNNESTAAHATVASKYRTLESVESLTTYDALIVGSPVDQGMMSAEMKGVLDEAGKLPGMPLAEMVGSAFGSPAPSHEGNKIDPVSMLATLMRLGMIVVPPAFNDDPDAARMQGARVAKVVGWIRHAKSHETHEHRH